MRFLARTNGELPQPRHSHSRELALPSQYDVYMTRDALKKGEQSFQAYKQAGGDVSMITKITNADEAEKVSPGGLRLFDY